MKLSEIRRRIEIYEYWSNGLKNLNGVEVTVKNIRVKKDSVIADVAINYYEDAATMTYRNVTYPLSELMKVHLS